MKSKHFKTEIELLLWFNTGKEIDGSYTKEDPPRNEDVVTVVKDHTNGDWILFYF